MNAIQWCGNNRVEVARFIKGAALDVDDTLLLPGDTVFIETVAGVMCVEIGEWIVRDKPDE